MKRREEESQEGERIYEERRDEESRVDNGGEEDRREGERTKRGEERRD